MFGLQWSQLHSPAQLLGYLALVLGVCAFLQRDDRALKVLLVSESCAYLVHFFLLGTPTAAAAAGLSGIRSLMALRYRSRRLALAFIGGYLAIGAALARTSAAWLPVLGSCLGAWALLTLDGIRMRLVLLAATSAWLASNVLSGSIGGTLLEGVIAVASSTTLVRMLSSSR